MSAIGSKLALVYAFRDLLVHHSSEWENGGQGQGTGGCEKLCVAHHPTAKIVLSQTRGGDKVSLT